MMNEAQKNKCHAIIHSASAVAGFCGTSPIPGSDAIPIMAVQVGMIIALGEVFDVHFTKSYAESLVKTKLASEAGKMLAGQALKLIPGFGSIANATIAASITEALGWDVADEFSKRAA